MRAILAFLLITALFALHPLITEWETDQKRELKREQSIAADVVARCNQARAVIADPARFPPGVTNAEKQAFLNRYGCADEAYSRQVAGLTSINAEIKKEKGVMETVWNWIVNAGLTIAALLLLSQFVKIVHQQTAAIVVTLGRYSGTKQAGLRFVFWPFQWITARIDLRLREIQSEVAVKARDNVFVSIPLTTMLQVIPDKSKEAFYSLENPDEQIQAWVQNNVRAVTANMTLMEIFADREKIAEDTKKKLEARLTGFGYKIEDVVVDQPRVSDEVQKAFDAVIAADRNREAAQRNAQADKIKIVGRAVGEARAQIARAIGLSKARMTLANGSKDALAVFKESGLSAEDAQHFLLETNRLDAMRAVGQQGNLILMDMRNPAPLALPVLGDRDKPVGDGAAPPANDSGSEAAE